MLSCRFYIRWCLLHNPNHSHTDYFELLFDITAILGTDYFQLLLDIAAIFGEMEQSFNEVISS